MRIPTSRFMNLTLIDALAVLVVMPQLAQAQQNTAPPPAPKPTLAAVQKVVQTISRDKAKVKIYCDVAKLNYQIGAAEAAKNQARMAELGKQADAMEQQLGPEYNKMMAGLEQVDPSSKEGRAYGAALMPLEKMCPNPGGRAP